MAYKINCRLTQFPIAKYSLAVTLSVWTIIYALGGLFIRIWWTKVPHHWTNVLAVLTYRLIGAMLIDQDEEWLTADRIYVQM